MIKYSKIHTDNIRIIQPRIETAKYYSSFEHLLRIHKIVRSDLINNLDHPCPPPPYENNFFNIRRIVFVCEVCGKHHLRKFELERIENKFRASRMGVGGWTDGRTDLALLVNVSRPTFFLGRYLVTALQLCARGRKLLIRKKSIRRAD